ncbi:adenine nucleotide alpha hydrolase [Chelatococcus sp. GCM10030263]|uniref:adenine nucleotide alpha hydrolase n=1 Tax=Chelatococcus sp. GCM10030263 TaxID=3273387 RepID=UPI003619F2B7
MSTDALAEKLAAALARHGSLAIAVSGGVDSMTLAATAHRRMPAGTVSMIHAVSPAVPQAATERVKARAAAEGWALSVTGAGEFDDPRYRANPVDRCYFCKSSLYDRIRAITPATIASGANLDDLGDYRPGLLAAAERDVVHPFVEAELAKADVRRLAHRLGLDEVAELPAQPCLASRVETGIAISAEDLAFIDETETRIAALLPAGATLRCRVTHAGIVIELDDAADAKVRETAEALCAGAGRRFAGVRPYKRGAAFLRAAP